MATILTNAHLYMGTSQFGKVNEFKFPDISTVTVESKPIDFIGKVKLPIGIELDDSAIKLNGFDSGVFTQLSDINKEHIITVRGNMNNVTSDGSWQGAWTGFPSVFYTEMFDVAYEPIYPQYFIRCTDAQLKTPEYLREKGFPIVVNGG